MKKIVLRILIVIITLFIIFAAIFCAFVFNKANAVVNPQRKILISSPEDNGLYFDSFETENKNGRIKGWYIPAQKEKKEIIESKKTIITSHNYSDNMEMNDISFLSLAKFLTENGYNIVMFDYTGSGSSEGKNYTFGQTEEIEDLSAIINYVKTEYPEDEITLYGWAFGAAAAIYAADTNNIKNIISDSSYIALSPLLDEKIEKFTGSKGGFFNACVKSVLPIVSSVDYNMQTPLETIEKMSDKNFLFIHGENDSVINVENSQRLYSAASANNNAKLYTIPDCEHIYGFMESEINYKNTLLAFLEEVYS